MSSSAASIIPSGRLPSPSDLLDESDRVRALPVSYWDGVSKEQIRKRTNFTIDLCRLPKTKFAKVREHTTSTTIDTQWWRTTLCCRYANSNAMQLHAQPLICLPLLLHIRFVLCCYLF